MTVINKWANMTTGEREARSESLRAKKKAYWASLSPSQIEEFKQRTAEGRRRSPHWNGALSQSIPRGRYRAAGLPDDEIEYLMTLSGPQRKAARLRMRDYGLSPIAYRDLFASQDGRCALCLIDLSTVKIDVDHDHQTGRIRGLLCTRCNLGVGHIEERGAGWAIKVITWIAARSDPEAD